MGANAPSFSPVVDMSSPCAIEPGHDQLKALARLLVRHATAFLIAATDVVIMSSLGLYC